MPAPTRRHRVRLPAAERRGQVLRAATTLIAERGYWGLSLQDVADACELSQPGLLHYFPSKEALLTGVLEYRDQRDIETLAAQLGVDVVDVTDGDVRRLGVSLTGFLDAVIARNAQQREIVRLYSVMQAESLDREHPAHAYFAHRQAISLAAMAQLAPEGGLETARLVLALLDGLQLQWLREPGLDLVTAWRGITEGIPVLRHPALTGDSQR